MRYILFVLFAIFTFVGSAMAVSIEWTVDGSPDGYILYYKEVGSTAAYNQHIITPGTLRTYDLAPLNLVPMTRYEIYLTATKSGSQSGPSDIIRFTMPKPQQVIEIPATQPSSITIKIDVK